MLDRSGGVVDNYVRLANCSKCTVQPLSIHIVLNTYALIIKEFVDVILIIIVFVFYYDGEINSYGGGGGGSGFVNL